MRFAVLGPLAATDERRVDPDRPAQRRLLAILLLQPTEPIETDTLIDRFWAEDPPRTARAALQTHIAAIRHRLGSDVVRTTPTGYRLDLEGHELHRHQFERHARAARDASTAGRWEDAANEAQRALELWRGDPFPDLAGDGFAQPEIARLEETRMELLELRGRAMLAIGRGEQVLPDLEAAAEEDPLRERLIELVMLARTRAGRPAEALESYQRLRVTLAEMGLEPSPPLRDLEERILREDPTLVPPRVHHNLPDPGTSFIGRDAELEELSDLIEKHRLVTVTGMGGTGKTRLSVEVARRLLDRFPDGVHLVELGGLVDPELVLTEVAATLGLRSERKPTLDAIVDALRNRTVLVLLDNCEHLIDVSATVATAIVESAPGAAVLATSREAFGMPAERVFEALPLDVPPEGTTDVADVGGHDAVRLFVDRAAAGFSLTADTAAAVATICRRLDGLPLAIELAAARTRSMSLAGIAEHLDDRLGLQVGSRHGIEQRQRTLEAAIDWSYQLLDEPERALLRYLAVFRASFDLDAAEAICASAEIPREAVAHALARLVEQSLLRRHGRAGDRYRLLETIRRFARDRLEEHGGADEIRRRHRDWYLALAEVADTHLEDAEQPEWLDRLSTDRGNFDAALDHSVEVGDAVPAARLAEALAWYHARGGQWSRAVTEMRIALEHLDPAADPERAAAIRVRLAGTMYSSGDEAGAVAEAQRACDLVADRGPSRAKVRALSELASLHLRIVQQDSRPAIDAAREAVAVADAISDRYAQSHALRTLGTALCWAGDVEEGIGQLREALALSTAIANPTAILGVYMRLYISLVDFARDDEEAARVAEEALGWLETEGGRWGQATNLLMWFAYGFIRGGQWPRAEEMLDQSATYHIEGMSAMSYHALRGILRWMQGRLTEAQTEVRLLRATNPRPRYFRLLYPVEAEVAADEGRLADVRRLAAEHLAAEVIPAEEAAKAGTLRALVRAEMDAADTDAAAAPDHVARAEHATAVIRRLVAGRSTDPLSGLQLEPPTTSLALAEAELARGTGAAPAAWAAAREGPLFAYWRAYATWRLGESLVATGRSEKGVSELRDARLLADALGATLIRARIDALARRLRVSLSPQSTPPGRSARRPRPGRTAP